MTPEILRSIDPRLTLSSMTIKLLIIFKWLENCNSTFEVWLVISTNKFQLAPLHVAHSTVNEVNFNGLSFVCN